MIASPVTGIPAEIENFDYPGNKKRRTMASIIEKDRSHERGGTCPRHPSKNPKGMTMEALGIEV